MASGILALISYLSMTDYRIKLLIWLGDDILYSTEYCSNIINIVVTLQQHCNITAMFCAVWDALFTDAIFLYRNM